MDELNNPLGFGHRLHCNLAEFDLSQTGILKSNFAVAEGCFSHVGMYLIVSGSFLVGIAVGLLMDQDESIQRKGVDQGWSLHEIPDEIQAVNLEVHSRSQIQLTQVFR